MGIILGTDGHIALGSNENAMPSTTMSTMATVLDVMGNVKTNITAVIIMVPSIMSVAPCPFLSYTMPNSGVKSIVLNGSIEGMAPAQDGSTPYLYIMILVAKSRKGYNAE